MAFRTLSSFHMQSVGATFFGLPEASRRGQQVRRTGFLYAPTSAPEYSTARTEARSAKTRHHFNTARPPSGLAGRTPNDLS